MTPQVCHFILAENLMDELRYLIGDTNLQK